MLNCRHFAFFVLNYPSRLPSSKLHYSQIEWPYGFSNIGNFRHRPDYAILFAAERLQGSSLILTIQVHIRSVELAPISRPSYISSKSRFVSVCYDVRFPLNRIFFHGSGGREQVWYSSSARSSIVEFL